MRGLSALGGSSAVSVNQSKGKVIAGEEAISRGRESEIMKGLLYSWLWSRDRDYSKLEFSLPYKRERSERKATRLTKDKEQKALNSLWNVGEQPASSQMLLLLASLLTVSPLSAQPSSLKLPYTWWNFSFQSFDLQSNSLDLNQWLKAYSIRYYRQ